MRSAAFHALVMVLLLLGGTRDASATATFDLIFRGSGTPTTTASGGFVTADLLMTISSAGLGGAAVSVGWDTSFGVVVSAAVQWVGGKFPDNTPGPPDSVNMVTLGPRVLPDITNAPPGPGYDNDEGFVSNYTALVELPAAPPALGPGTFNIGTVVWDTSGGVVGSTTAVAVVIREGLDGAFDGDGVDVSDTVTLNGGSIEVVPEPGTAALLGIGLAGLVAARRSRRG